MNPIITHPEHFDSYHAGYDAMQAYLAEHDFVTARNEFNKRHPLGMVPATLAAYYYAKGEMQALCDFITGVKP